MVLLAELYESTPQICHRPWMHSSSFYFIGREKMFHFPRINPFWVAACPLTTSRASLRQLTLPSLVSAIPFSLSMASLPSDFKYTWVSSQKAPQQKECWGRGNCSPLDMVVVMRLCLQKQNNSQNGTLKRVKFTLHKLYLKKPGL